MLLLETLFSDGLLLTTGVSFAGRFRWGLFHSDPLFIGSEERRENKERSNGSTFRHSIPRSTTSGISSRNVGLSSHAVPPFTGTVPFISYCICESTSDTQKVGCHVHPFDLR